jgi:hypothetical protein
MIRPLFDHLLQGNKDAVDLCVLVFDWANAYDHLVDNDEIETPREQLLHRAMWLIAVEAPRNPFFMRHAAELSVSMANAITTWRASTTLQRQADHHAATLAHVMRWAPIEFFIHCARLVGGHEWADECAPGFWRAMTKDHSFEEFLSECGGT